MTIDMLNKDANGNKMVYSKEVAQIFAVGETITWLNQLFIGTTKDIM